jgi:hypothetical protein
MINPRGGDFYLATTGDHNLAVDTDQPLSFMKQIGGYACGSPRRLDHLP